MSNGMSAYEQAVLLLPKRLRKEAEIPDKLRTQVEEIRLRAGRKLSVLIPEGETTVGEKILTAEDIDGVVEIATEASAYSVRESMKNGYITVNGGFRIGLCGNVVVRNGEIEGFRELSSAAIRLPKEIKGIAEKIIASLVKNGRFESTLIVSPPGAGKTTLLRDLIRLLSDGDKVLGIQGARIALADERGEIACLNHGIPEMNVGGMTDIMDGCPKAQGVIMMLRTMNPQIIAIDEITAHEDINAIQSCANCGVRLLATAHGESVNDLKSRRAYREILDSGVFKQAVFIEKTGGSRRYFVEKLEGNSHA